MKRLIILIVGTAAAAVLVHAWVARKPAPPAPPLAAAARQAASANPPALEIAIVAVDAVEAVDAAAGSPERDRQVARAIEVALASNDAGRRETAFAVLLPELLETDPGLLVDLVARHAPGEARDALRDEVARRWITHDTAAAVAWLQSQEDARGSANVAIRALAAVSPAQAVDAADRLGVGRDDGSVAHILQIWAADSPREAQRWVDNQKPAE